MDPEEEIEDPIVERTYYHPLNGMILRASAGRLSDVEENAVEGALWIDGLYDAETQYIDVVTLEVKEQPEGLGVMLLPGDYLVPVTAPPEREAGLLRVLDYEFGDKVISTELYDSEGPNGLPKIYVTYPGTYRVETFPDFPKKNTSQIFTLQSADPPPAEGGYYGSEITVLPTGSNPRRMAWIEEQRVAALDVINDRMRAIWANVNAKDPWVDIILTHVSVQAYAYLIDPDRDANLNTRYAALVQAQPMFGSTALEVATWVVEQEAVPSTEYLLSIYLNYKNTMTLLSATFNDVANINTLVQNFLDSTEQYLQ